VSETGKTKGAHRTQRARMKILGFLHQFHGGGKKRIVRGRENPQRVRCEKEGKSGREAASFI